MSFYNDTYGNPMANPGTGVTASRIDGSGNAYLSNLYFYDGLGTSTTNRYSLRDLNSRNPGGLYQNYQIVKTYVNNALTDPSCHGDDMVTSFGNATLTTEFSNPGDPNYQKFRGCVLAPGVGTYPGTRFFSGAGMEVKNSTDVYAAVGGSGVFMYDTFDQIFTVPSDPHRALLVEIEIGAEITGVTSYPAEYRNGVSNPHSAWRLGTFRFLVNSVAPTVPQLNNFQTLIFENTNASIYAHSQSGGAPFTGNLSDGYFSYNVPAGSNGLNPNDYSQNRNNPTKFSFFLMSSQVYFYVNEEYVWTANRLGTRYNGTQYLNNDIGETAHPATLGDVCVSIGMMTPLQDYHGDATGQRLLGKLDRPLIAPPPVASPVYQNLKNPQPDDQGNYNPAEYIVPVYDQSKVAYGQGMWAVIKNFLVAEVKV